MSTWFGPRDVEASASFAESMVESAGMFDLMVVLVASGSNASPHVALELNLAISFGEKVLPLRLELIEPTGAMRYFLGLLQWMLHRP